MKRVRELMTVSVETARRTDSLLDAARKMRRSDIGALPVVDKNTVVGIVTDRDLVMRGLAEDRDLHKTHVGEIMSTNLRTVRPDEDIEKAARLMAQNKVRRMIVMDDRHQLAGMVTLTDLANRATGVDGDLGDEVLHAVSRTL